MDDSKQRALDILLGLEKARPLRIYQDKPELYFSETAGNPSMAKLAELARVLLGITATSAPPQRRLISPVLTCV